jgi:hypothetical protein
LWSGSDEDWGDKGSMESGSGRVGVVREETECDGGDGGRGILRATFIRASGVPSLGVEGVTDMSSSLGDGDTLASPTANDARNRSSRLVEPGRFTGSISRSIVRCLEGER